MVHVGSARYIQAPAHTMPQHKARDDCQLGAGGCTTARPAERVVEGHQNGRGWSRPMVLPRRKSTSDADGSHRVTYLMNEPNVRRRLLLGPLLGHW